MSKKVFSDIIDLLNSKEFSYWLSFHENKKKTKKKLSSEYHTFFTKRKILKFIYELYLCGFCIDEIIFAVEVKYKKVRMTENEVNQIIDDLNKFN